MSSYVLTAKAVADIEMIARASLRAWGYDRTQSYIKALHATFSVLSEFPGMGQRLEELRPGIMMMPAGSHLVFYRKRQGPVLIVRVLHRRMDVFRH